MKIDKLKSLLIATCCFVVSLWTEVQGMDKKSYEDELSVFKKTGETIKLKAGEAIREYEKIKSVLEEKLNFVKIMIKDDQEVEFDKISKDNLIERMIRRFPNPEEKILEFITNDNKVDMKRVMDECENILHTSPYFVGWSTPNNVQQEINLAIRNGDIHKDFFHFNTPRIDQNILVLGCGHGTKICPNHQLGRNTNHYTVDINYAICPDTVSDIFCVKLWQNLPKNHFEQVIAEGLDVVTDSSLMKSILEVLKPGGVFKTLHGHSSSLVHDGKCTVEAFLYRSTLSIIGQPLLNITYKEHLEKIGFINIQTYIPSCEEDLWEIRTEQICASKPE